MTKDEVIEHMLKELARKYPRLANQDGDLSEFLRSSYSSMWGKMIDDMHRFGLEISVEPKMYRSGADSVCEACHEPYFRHPPHTRSWAMAGEDLTTFRRLCNGDLVKL